MTSSHSHPNGTHKHNIPLFPPNLIPSGKMWNCYTMAFGSHPTKYRAYIQFPIPCGNAKPIPICLRTSMYIYIYIYIFFFFFILRRIIVLKYYVHTGSWEDCLQSPVVGGHEFESLSPYFFLSLFFFLSNEKIASFFFGWHTSAHRWRTHATHKTPHKTALMLFYCFWTAELLLAQIV